MKSICFVVTTPFAVNAFLLGHFRALADEYYVSLCTNVSEYPISAAIDPRVRVLNIGIRRKISFLLDLYVLWRLFRLFRKERFDAVHSITPKAGLLAILAAFFARVPRRYHTFTGQIWATRKGFSRTFFKLIDRLIFATATKVFSDSPSQNRFLESEGIVKRGSISVLGRGSISGVDGARFCSDAAVRRELRASLSTTENACIFLFVGRIATDKGVVDLLQAFDQLSDVGNEIELWLVGPDEEGLQKELEKVSSERLNRVRWMGATFEPQRYMAAADVLMLPSYREGFGLVVAEAASCGIPAIAYRIDGVIDSVNEGKTGLLVPKGNIESLVEAMQMLAVNLPYRNELGRNALEYVRQNFLGSAVTAAWLDFYRKEIPSTTVGSFNLCGAEGSCLNILRNKAK